MNYERCCPHYCFLPHQLSSIPLDRLSNSFMQRKSKLRAPQKIPS